MLNGGAEQAHQLKEFTTAAWKQIFEPLEFVDGDEDATTVGKPIELFEPSFGSFHRRTVGERRKIDAPVTLGLDGGLLRQ